MNRIMGAVLVALFVALLIASFFQSHVGLERSLLTVGLRDRAVMESGELSSAPVEALMLYDEYGPEAYLAAKKYPEATLTLYGYFGDTSEWKHVLETYGYHQVVPVVWGYWERPSVAFEAKRRVGTLMRNAWDAVQGTKKPEEILSQPASSLTSIERAWIAINRVHESGNNFLGRFVIKDGKAELLYVKTATAVAEEFMVSGIQTVERKYKLDEKITAMDAAAATIEALTLGWAGVASFRTVYKAGFGARTVIRAGKTARNLGRMERINLLGGRMAASLPNVFRSRVVKYGLVGFGGYLALKHPSVVNAAMGELANIIGISPFVLQMGAWTMIFLVPLYLLSWLILPIFKFLLVPVARMIMRRAEKS